MVYLMRGSPVEWRQCARKDTCYAIWRRREAHGFSAQHTAGTSAERIPLVTCWGIWLIDESCGAGLQILIANLQLRECFEWINRSITPMTE